MDNLFVYGRRNKGKLYFDLKMYFLRAINLALKEKSNKVDGKLISDICAEEMFNVITDLLDLIEKEELK